tara:strand:+ start:495 stop:1052 length:558 start_codon:yes stop_codon:yes gene_type:complete
MTKKTREEKYQALRLYHSGQMSLSDIKASFRITATVTRSQYSKQSDQKQFLGTKERLERLERMAMTRDIAKMRMLMRFNKKPKLTRNRNEVIASYALGDNITLPHDWKRYGNLQKRTKRVNKPRIGSSLGKLGKTKYIGFKKFNKDYDKMMKALLNFSKDRPEQGKAIAGRMAKVRNMINVSTKG